MSKQILDKATLFLNGKEIGNCEFVEVIIPQCERCEHWFSPFLICRWCSYDAGTDGPEAVKQALEREKVQGEYKECSIKVTLKRSFPPDTI